MRQDIKTVKNEKRRKKKKEEEKGEKKKESQLKLVQQLSRTFFTFTLEVDRSKQYRV